MTIENEIPEDPGSLDRAQIQVSAAKHESRFFSLGVPISYPEAIIHLVNVVTMQRIAIEELVKYLREQGQK